MCTADAAAGASGAIASGSGISSLIVKVAERCNLNCGYCYMYQHADKSWVSRPPIMSDETFACLLRRAREYCDRRPGHRMEITFHGGEPMLAGPRRLRRFAAMAREQLGDRLSALAMQTNGTLIDDRAIEAIRSARIQTSVSMDGSAEIHDRTRQDHFGRGTHAAAERGLRRLQDAGLEPGILCVIDPGAEGLAIFRYFRSLGVSAVDFLFPDVTHDTRARFYGDRGATPVAEYLIPIFDEWFADDNPAIVLRIFWSLMSLILGGSSYSDAFGNPKIGYLVIDSDGSIQPLDALKTCADGLADSGLNVAQHGFDDLRLGHPILRQMAEVGIPLSAVCEACPDRPFCGGGYITQRYSKQNGFDNPSVWCEDIKALLAHIKRRMAATMPVTALPQSLKSADAATRRSEGPVLATPPGFSNRS